MGVIMRVSKLIKVIIQSDRAEEDKIIIEANKNADLKITAPRHYSIDRESTLNPEEQEKYENRGNNEQSNINRPPKKK